MDDCPKAACEPDCCEEQFGTFRVSKGSCCIWTTAGLAKTVLLADSAFIFCVNYAPVLKKEVHGIAVQAYQAACWSTSLYIKYLKANWVYDGTFANGVRI